MICLLFPPIAAAERSAPTAAIQQALAKPIVAPDIVLEEVCRFTESRVPAMPQVQSADEWRKTATRIRDDMLQKVVLRGEAARWAEGETKTEWLDTIPGGPGYTIRKFRFEAVPGLWVPALLYVPENITGRVPVVLNVNGHDPKGKAVDYKQIRCINQAKRGMIAMNVEWFGMGQLATEGFKHYRANQLDLCGTSAVAPFYLSMKRSLDILTGLPQADPQRVAVAGLSGGGWQTIFISSLDERVALSNPVAGYSSFKTRARYPSDLGDTEQTPCDMATVADYTHLTAMRAPQPTLLTNNSKDNCCFAAAHAQPPLLDAAGPIFALFGQRANLRLHVNDDPGTHNFEQDNREQLYRMIGDHFYADQGFDWHEFECASELKTAEQLFVPLPENNEDFNTLARKLAQSLPPRLRINCGRPPAEFLKQLEAFMTRRERLGSVVRFAKYDVVSAVSQETTNIDGIRVKPFKLSLGKDWTVPATELSKPGATGTTLVIADAGRKSAAAAIAELLGAGQRVLAVDPFTFGESTITPRNELYAMLVAGVGERPLGIQAGQVASIATWASKQYGNQTVSLLAIGPRTSTIAIIAAALERGAIGSLEVRDPLKSLKLLIDENRSIDQTPELFCFGLLEQFDITQIVEMISPRPVKGF